MTTPRERTYAVLGLGIGVAKLQKYISGCSNENVSIPKVEIEGLLLELKHYPTFGELALSADKMPSLWGELSHLGIVANWKDFHWSDCSVHNEPAGECDCNPEIKRKESSAVGSIMNKAMYLEVKTKIRRWEDTTVNGVQDETGALIPFRRLDYWCPVIRLSDGLVLEWPVGMTANILYKCDESEYWLLNSERKRIAQCNLYRGVDLTCIGYMIFNIGANGTIKNYRKPEIKIINDRHEPEWLKYEG
jgi:hypothetical protein